MSEKDFHARDTQPQILGDKDAVSESTLNFASIAMAGKESVVQVCGTDAADKKSWDCGSAFMVAKDGLNYLITNDHVFSNLKNLEITTSAGARLSVDAVAEDKGDDLAALKLSGSIPIGLKPLSIGSTQAVFRGSEIAAVGYSMGEHRLSISPGIVAGKELLRDIKPLLTQPLAPQADLNRVQLDGEVLTHEGESGSPVLDKQNKVVGVVTYTDSASSTVAATAEELVEFLARATFRPIDKK